VYTKINTVIIKRHCRHPQMRKSSIIGSEKIALEREYIKKS